MHSLNHPVLGRAIAAERAQASRGRAKPGRSHRPPPIRSRVAYLTARAARRLDAKAARRAVA